MLHTKYPNALRQLRQRIIIEQIMVDEYQVDGVIDCSLMFCCLYDTEKLAVSEALKAKNIPVLSLETDYTDKDAEQLRTRIGAFVEMLNQ